MKFERSEIRSKEMNDKKAVNWGIQVSQLSIVS